MNIRKSTRVGSPEAPQSTLYTISGPSMKELPETTRQPFIPSQHHYHSFIFPSCHHDSTRTDYERRNSPTSYLFLSLFSFSFPFIFYIDAILRLVSTLPYPSIWVCVRRRCVGWVTETNDSVFMLNLSVRCSWFTMCRHA